MRSNDAGTLTALLLGCALHSLAAQASDNGRGRHRQLYAVPTPGRVVIDGRLDDWDLSARSRCSSCRPRAPR